MTWITASTFEAGSDLGQVIDWTPVWADESLIYIFFTDTDAVDGVHNLYALIAHFDGAHLSFVSPISGLKEIVKLGPCDGRIVFAQRTPSGYGVFVASTASGDTGSTMFAINDPVDSPNYQVDNQPCSWRGDELVGFISGTGPVIFGTLTDLYDEPYPMNDIPMNHVVTVDAIVVMIETAGPAVYYSLDNTDTHESETWKCEGATATLLDDPGGDGIDIPHSVDNQTETDPRILNGLTDTDVELVGLILNNQLTHSVETTLPNRWWTGEWHGMVQNASYHEREQPPGTTPPPELLGMGAKTSAVDPDYVIAFSYDPDTGADVIQVNEWVTASLTVSDPPATGVIKFFYYDGSGFGPTLIGTGPSQVLFDGDESITEQLDNAYHHDNDSAETTDWLFIYVEDEDPVTHIPFLVPAGGMSAEITWTHQPPFIPGATLLPTGEYLFSGVNGASEESSFSPDPDLGATLLRSAWWAVPTGRYTAVAAPTEYGGTGDGVGTLAIHFLAGPVTFIDPYQRVHPRDDGRGTSSAARSFPVPKGSHARTYSRIQ